MILSSTMETVSAFRNPSDHNMYFGGDAHASNLTDLKFTLIKLISLSSSYGITFFNNLDYLFARLCNLL